MLPGKSPGNIPTRYCLLQIYHHQYPDLCHESFEIGQITIRPEFVTDQLCTLTVTKMYVPGVSGTQFVSDLGYYTVQPYIS